MKNLSEKIERKFKSLSNGSTKVSNASKAMALVFLTFLASCTKENNAPEITNFQEKFEIELAEGANQPITVTDFDAFDLDGDEIEFRVQGNGFSIDAKTGVLTADITPNQIKTATVTVTDGQDETDYGITVEAVEEATTPTPPAPYTLSFTSYNIESSVDENNDSPIILGSFLVVADSAGTTPSAPMKFELTGPDADSLTIVAQSDGTYNIVAQDGMDHDAGETDVKFGLKAAIGLGANKVEAEKTVSTVTVEDIDDEKVLDREPGSMVAEIIEHNGFLHLYNNTKNEYSSIVTPAVVTGRHAAFDFLSDIKGSHSNLRLSPVVSLPGAFFLERKDDNGNWTSVHGELMKILQAMSRSGSDNIPNYNQATAFDGVFAGSRQIIGDLMSEGNFAAAAGAGFVKAFKAL